MRSGTIQDNLDELHETLITLTAEIVAAHVSNNSVAVSDLPVLINNVHSTLSGLGSAPVLPPAPKQEPAVSIRASIKPDYIVCLEDGEKLKMLKRHLMTYYQMCRSSTAPSETCRRTIRWWTQLRRTAPDAGQKEIGLGTKRRKIVR